VIAPRARLLIIVGFLGVPAALAAALEPRARAPAAAAAVFFVALAAVDAFTVRSRLAGLLAELPALVRLAVDRPGAIGIRLWNPRRGALSLRVGLVLPGDLGSPVEVQSVDLPAGAESSRFDWPCRPLRRGRYVVDRIHLERPSLLGLWDGRRAPAVRSELRVYPSLVAERRSMAALFLNRGAFGVHAIRQVGKGREFERLREYAAGDGFEDIHWKATAKRGKPVTKVYQIERTQEVYVVLDSSRLSARRSGRSTVLDRAITAALVLGLAAEKQGDLFGLVSFADGVRTFVRARNGRSHYGTCREALYTLEPSPASPDFDELASFLHLRLRRRALLVVLTSLDDPIIAEAFTRALEVFRRRHLVLVNMVTPPGVEPLFSGQPVAAPDQIYDRLAGHLRWRALRETGAAMQRAGVKFSLIEDERMSADLVAQYLGVKRRQML
jgi:uncharacterized protein (DUF58 family)